MLKEQAAGGRSESFMVFAIFVSVFINSYTFFTEPFEFYLGYLVYIVLLPVFLIRHGSNRILTSIFVILFLSGVFNIFIGNNTPELFFKVFLGLTLSYFFYYYVIVEFKFNIKQLFIWYLTGAYWVSILGIMQFVFYIIGYEAGYNFWGLFNKWGFTPGGLFGIRINSVFAEPTHLGTVLSAAFFVAAYSLTRKESYYYTRFKGAVVIIAYFLSFSALGQTGIFLTVLFIAINFGFVRYIIVAVPLLFIMFNIVYNNVSDFKDRYDGLVSLFSGEKLEIGKTHGSSFILYNNYHVTIENFKSNFLFGSGIGSHPVAFKKYSLAKDIKISGFNNNSADANSMLLRLLSETGLFGVAIFIYLTFKCYVQRSEEHDTHHWLISNALLIMILLNLFRQGHYFLNGFPLFVLLYLYNYLSYEHYLETGELNYLPEDTEE